jgi:hypothetical protein
MGAPLRVFISYSRHSRQDSALKDRLIEQLKVLERFDSIVVWTDDQIAPGADWRDEIDKAMATTDVAILLLSESSLASGFIADTEIPALLKRRASEGLVVIPVILRECLWEHHPAIASFQVLPKNAKPIAAYTGNRRTTALKQVAEVIATVAKSDTTRRQSSPALPDHIAKSASQNPFQKVGTLAAHKPCYVERACDGELYAALNVHPLIVIHGDFGIGKSSLLLRAEAKLSGNQNALRFDLGTMRTDSPPAFFRRFFDNVNRKLGKIEDWQDLADAAAQQPLSLLIDEFGHLTDELAQSFIPPLFQLATTQEHVRVIVCLPTSIQEFLNARGLKNPKFMRGWQHVRVELLDDDAVERLLSLLPPPANATARALRADIINISKRQPRAVQCLCYELYEATSAGSTADELAALVRDRKYYE